MRVTAIRRPGRRPETPRWRWFIAHCRGGQRGAVPRRGERRPRSTWTSPSTVATATCPPAHSSRSVRTASTTSAAPCAAVARLPAIAAEYPEFTWECSHLGGDRFAATMLMLPEGLCYGRVDSTDSAGLVGCISTGGWTTGILRGRTSLPHAVQAAQYFARESLGDDRIDALSPLKVEHKEGRIRVELALTRAP